MHSTLPSPAPPLMLADLTWPEVQHHVRSGSIVLLPLGAFEQHGPGMALETDTRLVTELCRRVSARLSPRVLVAPPVPWGLSDHHMGFAGTISLHPETFFTVIRDVVLSLLRHGFRRIVLVNGHGGNMAATEDACMRLRRETANTLIETVSYFTLADLPVSALEHAGEIETSCALALTPEVVRPEQLVPADMLAPQPGGEGTGNSSPLHELTRTGNLGDPTTANRERGTAVMQVVIDRLCEVVVREHLTPRWTRTSPLTHERRIGMSTQENKATVRKFVEEVQNGGNIDALDSYCSPEFVNLSAPPGMPSDSQGVKMVSAMFLAAFPNGRMTIRDMVAEGDKVVTRKSFRGTHQGELMGISPTGKEISIDIVDILRLDQGKVVEHWNLVDMLGLFQQLGVIPQAPGAET